MKLTASVRALVAVVGLSAAASISSAQITIKVDGSSTVQLITAAVAEQFENANAGIKVEVGTSGTGGGFKKFVRGEIDIADASRPILAQEMAEAKSAGIDFIEIPIAFDALTVMVHPENTFVDNITVAELKKIWEPAAKDTILRWSQVRAGWPDEKLSLYGPGTDSGTFDYFTEAIVGKAKSCRSDFTASENDNTLAQGISRDVHALGYFGYAHYFANPGKLKAIPVINPITGLGVLPSESSVHDGTYAPLSRPLFIYVNRKSVERPEVRRFIAYFLREGASQVTKVGYVPLTEGAYKSAMERVAKKQIGTAFAGHSQVGLHIDELFDRPLSSEIPPADAPHDGGKHADEKPMPPVRAPIKK